MLIFLCPSRSFQAYFFFHCRDLTALTGLFFFFSFFLSFSLFLSFRPCCAVCGILVLQPGIEPMSPALGAQSLNHWTAREVPTLTVLYLIFKFLNYISLSYESTAHHKPPKSWEPWRWGSFLDWHSPRGDTAPKGKEHTSACGALHVWG